MRSHRHHVTITEQASKALAQAYPDLPIAQAIQQALNDACAARGVVYEKATLIAHKRGFVYDLRDCANVTVSDQVPPGAGWFELENIPEGYAAKVETVKRYASVNKAVWVKNRKGQNARFWVRAL